MCDVCFCFKQKAACEMRISGWSSDVCSSDLLDEIALGEIIFGQRTDVDGQAVHRYAHDDRQPCAAMPGGPAAAQAAWPAVGIAERDRRKPLRRRRDMIEAITDPRPRLDGADLEHAGVEPDNGA